MSRVDSFLSDLQKKDDGPKKKDRQWRPLLGQVLEYGDSGFLIVLQKNSKRHPFSLRDPDGREIGSGDMLNQLKSYAEQQAKFRDEFEMAGDLSSVPDFSKFKGDA